MALNLIIWDNVIKSYNCPKSTIDSSHVAHINRIPEFESLAQLLNVKMEWVERSRVEPWVIVDLEEGEDAAKRILSRSISAKYCIQG